MKKILILSILALLTPIIKAEEQTEFQWKGVSIGLIFLIGIFILIAFYFSMKVIHFIAGLGGLITLFVVGGLVCYWTLGGSLTDFWESQVKNFYKVPWAGWQLLLQKAGLGGLLTWSEGFNMGSLIDLITKLINWFKSFGGGS